MSKSTVITRKDMKEPDKFQTAATQAASWVASRKKHVILAAGAVVAVLVILLAVAAIQANREQKAGLAADPLLATIAAPVGPAGGAPGARSFPDEDAKQRAIIAEAERVVAEHGGTGPADLALLAAGDAHYKLREWDAAKASYDRYLGAASKDDSLRFGALSGLALVAEAKGDATGAAEAWDRLGRDVPTFADRADLERARVLARSGKTAEAKELLSGFAGKHPESPLLQQASQQLAQLGGK